MEEWDWLAIQVTDLTKELALKREEVRYFHAKQQAVLNWIRILVGQSCDIKNRLHLFGNNYKTDGHVLAAKVIPILVKFSKEMEEILCEIKKLMAFVGPNIWMVVHTAPVSPAMVFEWVGEVNVTVIELEPSIEV